MTTRNGACRTRPAPAVSHIEGFSVEVSRLPLSEHKDRLNRVELAAQVVPKIERNIARAGFEDTQH